MAKRLRPLAFFLILLPFLFSSMLPVSETRPLLHNLPWNNNVMKEVNGIFRTLKSSGPSTGGGHRLKKLQHLALIKDLGPSPGTRHKPKGVEKLVVVKNSGPSPGEGHKYISGKH